MQPASIGPYQVQRELGHGGMGEVFLARDTRLDRLVAVKALPAHLAQDPDRLARFQREAKVLASLNHPGIAAIYGLEEQGEHRYLILEYVEGETVAQRLRRGAIPPAEALSMARQMAEALEAAHEKGVVHRDLKPANMMVTPEGVVKVLDFGLARSEGADPPSAATFQPDGPTSPARSPHSPTIPGAIMGTAGYMSPEQARGRAVDKRSDIFSFGCVLYEMLTGDMPFHGETVADAIGATLHKESDLSALPAGTPARVRDLLAACLVKDRRNRLHDIGDARIELERAIAEPRGAAASLPAARPWWRSPAVLVAALAGAASVSPWVFMRTPGPAADQGDPRTLRAGLPLPRGMDAVQGDRAVAVSPDGSRIVVSLKPKDRDRGGSLFLRELSRLEFRPLPGTENATYPFWSPDGSSLAFFSDRKLRRLDLAEGIVRVLCEAPAGRGGSWGPRGTIVFAAGAGGGLSVVSDSGGTPTPVTTTERPGDSHRLPQFLPDGRSFLYFIGNTAADGVYAFDAATGKSRLVLRGQTEAFYVDPGFLVFAQDENLMVQPIDPARVELTGSARPIAAGAQYGKVRAFINGGVSPRGTLVYQTAVAPDRYRLAWMDRKGERTAVPVDPFEFNAFSPSSRISKDGRRAVVSIAGSRGESSTVLVDLERGIRTLISDPTLTNTYGGVWTADEQGVIVNEVRGGVQHFVSCPVGGVGVRATIMDGESGFENEQGSVTPDGRTLIFVKRRMSDKAGDIMTVPVDGSGPASAFMTTPESETHPRLSPSGDLLAYLVHKDQRPEGVLKVVAYPKPAEPLQVSVASDVVGCRWMGASELCWIDAAGRCWSAVLTRQGRAEVGPATPMFDGKAFDPQTRFLDYDAARDRFLIATMEETTEAPELILVSDWRQGIVGAPASPR